MYSYLSMPVVLLRSIPDGQVRIFDRRWNIFENYSFTVSNPAVFTQLVKTKKTIVNIGSTLYSFENDGLNTLTTCNNAGAEGRAIATWASWIKLSRLWILLVRRPLRMDNVKILEKFLGFRKNNILQTVHYTHRRVLA